MIHIWIRRTVDWADEEAALAQLTDPWLIPKVPVWNDTFNISYQRFRHRVEQIAQLNHSRVEGAVVSEWDEIPEGALVMPVDDDDWFVPGAARALEAERDPDAIGYLWPSRWIEVPINLGHRLYLLRRRLLPRTPPKWICSTNNYAMVKGPEVKEALGSHIEASHWFEGPLRRRDPIVKGVGEELSLANRTLASQTSLSHGRYEIGRAELLRKYRRYKRLYERALPPDLDWARPYAAMMGDLMAELEVR